MGGIDFVGLILAVVALSMATRLVLRTEKDLDKAAKFLLAKAVVLVLAYLILANNRFMQVIPESVSNFIFHSSRIAALLCYIAAMHYLIKITQKK
ncbi:MAG: hypothetical protein UR99_C0065G0003 [Candidatus Moranbacteria bacterium GW2011_GWD2_36_12]|nr:MAG: hypothetical protein UR99_C0065G0003 [Candidatus Moranbacteria bacterium GW2011_GWD2_36_12]